MGVGRWHLVAQLLIVHAPTCGPGTYTDLILHIFAIRFLRKSPPSAAAACLPQSRISLRCLDLSILAVAPPPPPPSPASSHAWPGGPR